MITIMMMIVRADPLFLGLHIPELIPSFELTMSQLPPLQFEFSKHPEFSVDFSKQLPLYLVLFRKQFLVMQFSVLLQG